jgi:hypothetical protein
MPFAHTTGNGFSMSNPTDYMNVIYKRPDAIPWSYTQAADDLEDVPSALATRFLLIHFQSHVSLLQYIPLDHTG